MGRSVNPNIVEGLLGKVHQGDCIEEMRKLRDGCIDLAFADPPFNIGYAYDQYKDRLAHDEYLAWSGAWMGEVFRVLKPDGTFWLAIGDEYAAELKLAAQKVGFRPRSWVIWYYTFGVHCKAKFTRSHAHLFYFVKDPSRFTFNAQAVAVPSARQRIYADSRANPDGRMPDDTWILRPQECENGLNPDEDVWFFSRVAGTFGERAGFHGCQMPELLLDRIVRACSKEGEIVLDPFSGSATTAAVAKKRERRFLAFELSADYAKKGNERLESIRAGDLPAGAGPDSTNLKSLTKPKRQAKSTKACVKTTRSQSGEAVEALGLEIAPLLTAFLEANRGFSVDRVVLDPLLNEDFQAACGRLSIGGAPVDRNRALLGIRKTGRLKALGIETSKQTRITWQQVDPYQFASEIAWHLLLKTYPDTSLDDIFCDPRLASIFDGEAARYAPGFTPLEYRWAALRIRKASCVQTRRAVQLSAEELGIRKFKTADLMKLEDFSLDDLPAGAGVYGFWETARLSLYVGETGNLRGRVALQLRGLDPAINQRVPRCREDLLIAYQKVDQIGDALQARQMRLQTWHPGCWNLSRNLAV